MVETKTIQIGGVVTILLLLLGGTTIYIQDAGSKTSCNDGWRIQINGKYLCNNTSKTEICFNTSARASSPYTPNYWCQRGKIVNVTLPENNTPVINNTIPINNTPVINNTKPINSSIKMIGDRPLKEICTDICRPV